METQTKMVLVARYQYAGGVVTPADSVVVGDRDPLKVPYQSGAISFDFTELYYFTCNGKTFQCASHDRETYYWGQELSLEEVASMPAFKDIEDTTECRRFVLTDWGALIPLCDCEQVIPHPTAFDLPGDMQPD